MVRRYLIIISAIILSFAFSPLCFACPPDADLDAIPATVYVGDSVLLDGSGSQSNGTIVKYQWDFTNDDSYDYGETSVSHPDGCFDGRITTTYSRAGTYTVKLRVTNSFSLTDTDTAIVTVVTRVKNITQDNKGYDYIQPAIDEADDYDIIEVNESTYVENIDFSNKQITVRSTDPNNWLVVMVTVICANDANFATVEFDDQAAISTLDGFRITGGFHGIECNDVSPIIKHCIISNNGSENSLGGGVYCEKDDGDPEIITCFIVDNDANYGGGIYSCNGSNPLIRNCVISNNTANEDGGGMYNTASSLRVYDCTVTDNDANNGGSLYSSSGVSINIVNSIFWDNYASDNGNEVYYAGTAPGFSYCDLEGCGGSGSWNSSFGSDGGNNIDQDPCFVSTEPSDSNLISLWKLDENTSTKAYDSIGDNDGDLINSPVWTDGKIDAALDFNGVSDYVQMTGYKGITGSASRTCTAWIKTNQKNGMILTWGEDVYGKAWNCRVNSDGTLRAQVRGGWINGTTNLADGRWHHIAVVLEDDGSPIIDEVELYVDGDLDPLTNTGSQRAIDTGSSQDVIIGTWLADPVYFNGIIDDVRIYDKALSTADVNAIFEYGVIGHCKYHLGLDSPCINAGDINGNYENQTDIDGEPRVMVDRVDIGADEVVITGLRVSAGRYHTLVLRGDPLIYVCGTEVEDHDSSGDGYFLGHPHPPYVSGNILYSHTLIRVREDDEVNLFDKDFKKISAGNCYSMAITKSGDAWAWGQNGHGELGNGEGGQSEFNEFPVQVLGGEQGGDNLENIVKISTGAYHSLACDSSGNAWAWGWGANGRLGLGDRTDYDTPQQVHGDNNDVTLANIIDVAAEQANHSLFLDNTTTNGGYVWATGLNEDGQLGTNDEDERTLPVRVLSGEQSGTTYLEDICDIAASSCNSYALESPDRNGYVYAWGNGGALGNGGTSSSLIPVIVKENSDEELTNIIAISAGHDFCVALESMEQGGHVYAWGTGPLGGRGAEQGDPWEFESNYAVKVEGEGGTGDLADIVYIDAGKDYVVAIDKYGRYLSWGNEYSRGLLGLGELEDNYAIYPTEMKEPIVLGSMKLEPFPTAFSGGTYSGDTSDDPDGSQWYKWRGQVIDCYSLTTSLSSSYEATISTWASGGPGQVAPPFYNDEVCSYQTSISIPCTGQIWDYCNSGAQRYLPTFSPSCNMEVVIEVHDDGDEGKYDLTIGTPGGCD